MGQVELGMRRGKEARTGLREGAPVVRLRNQG